jgi:hypothetical protein
MRGKLKDMRNALGNSNVLWIQESYVIVGIDPGIKSTATACIIDSSKGHARNISISQGSTSSSRRAIGMALTMRKAGVQNIENQIKPIEYPCTKIGEQEASWSLSQLWIGFSVGDGLPNSLDSNKHRMEQ